MDTDKRLVKKVNLQDDLRQANSLLRQISTLMPVVSVKSVGEQSSCSARVCPSCQSNLKATVNRAVQTDRHLRTTGKPSVAQHEETNRSQLWMDYVKYLAIQPGVLDQEAWVEYGDVLRNRKQLAPMQVDNCRRRFGRFYSNAQINTFLASIKYTEQWMREFGRRRNQEWQLIGEKRDAPHNAAPTPRPAPKMGPGRPTKVRMNRAALKRTEAIRARFQLCFPIA